MNPVTLEAALSVLHRLTKAGTITWKQHDPSLWIASGPVQAQIEYLRPMLPDGTTSGNDIARVTIGGYMDSVCSGTEGMALVRAILEAAFPDMASWTASCQAKLEEAFGALTSLLPEDIEFNG
jgi:hypothetical protein